MNSTVAYIQFSSVECGPEPTLTNPWVVQSGPLWVCALSPITILTVINIIIIHYYSLLFIHHYYSRPVTCHLIKTFPPLMMSQGCCIYQALRIFLHHSSALKLIKSFAVETSYISFCFYCYVIAQQLPSPMHVTGAIFRIC